MIAKLRLGDGVAKARAIYNASAVGPCAETCSPWRLGRAPKRFIAQSRRAKSAWIKSSGEHLLGPRELPIQQRGKAQQQLVGVERSSVFLIGCCYNSSESQSAVVNVFVILYLIHTQRLHQSLTLLVYDDAAVGLQSSQ